MARSNAGLSTLYWAAHHLYQGHDEETVIADIAAHLWRLAPDEAVRVNFGAGVEWYYRRSHKYVLYEYELENVRSESELPTWGELTSGATKTTEHILPQNPAEGSQWWKDFSREAHSTLLNTIGNLVLTRDNSAYSNKEYKLKRGEPGQERPRCYFCTSAFARERQVAQQFDTWTPATIEIRRQEIEGWALRRWHIDPPAQPYVEQDDEEEADVPEDEAALIE